MERRSSLTRHQMCLRCHWPAGVTWDQSSQWAGKSTLCELKACQHCEQREEKRCSDGEGFSVSQSSGNKKGLAGFGDSLCGSRPQSLIQVTKHGSPPLHSPLNHSGQHQAGHLKERKTNSQSKTKGDWKRRERVAFTKKKKKKPQR